jgi:DNA-binding NarL/FixJ family response regulator
MTSVVLADDQELVRSGFRLILEFAGIEVAGEAGDGREAVELVRRVQPDVVLMDVRMPVMDGIEATRRILGSVEGTRVIMLTTFDLDEYVFEALQIGASGFLLKDVEPDELRRAVRVVAAGEALLSPSVTRRLISEFVARPGRTSEPPALDELTDREREVLAHVAAGLSNDELAERLVISPATAKTHVSRILLKLGARDRAQLVMIAYETGLVRAAR